VGISRPSDHRYSAENGNLGAFEAFRAQRRAHAREHRDRNDSGGDVLDQHPGEVRIDVVS
jgi:hypothetical protein